jgi:hypothetical protein
MRSWPAVLAAAALTVSLSACSDDDGEPTAEDTPSSSPTPSETATPETSETPTPVESPTPTEDPATVVTITIAGDKITPGGDRVEIERGETVTLEITTDRAGELHVHSKPEQYVEFEAGTSTHELTIGAPGIVDVEEHETGHVVVQLEVT